MFKGEDCGPFDAFLASTIVCEYKMPSFISTLIKPTISKETLDLLPCTLTKCIIIMQEYYDDIFSISFWDDAVYARFQSAMTTMAEFYLRSAKTQHGQTYDHDRYHCIRQVLPPTSTDSPNDKLPIC